MHAPSIVVSDVAEEILSTLTSSAYRKNSLDRMGLAGCRSTMLSALRQCAKRGSPIQLTVLAFPFKVPNPAKVGARTLPDFAELAAIRQFCKFREAIRDIYTPGLEFHILHDGLLISEVFGVEPEEVCRYETYFANLVGLAGASHFVHCHDFGELQQRGGLDPSGSIEELRFEAERWWQRQRGTAEWRLNFRKTLGMMNLRNLTTASAADLLQHATRGWIPSGWEKVERLVHDAMVHYYVKDAIIHRFDPRPLYFADAIHATTQERQGRLAIWLVRRGQSILPWHGVGCLDDRGQAHVVYAADMLDQPDYHPVFVGAEDTPFLYRRTTTPPFGFEFGHE